ncbi:pseudouridine-5'-phosphatase-like isoform X1 [Tachypleus tridentatus]|uniref:pseudouridine-5'-phosphatase-like isoform X1 n=2 Tax=Tachypleus tridentatus TaxID=6853 RepID=UPI003FD2FDC1
MARYGRVARVIFDLDGLLVDSEPVYAKIARKVCKKYGKEYTRETHMKEMGLSVNESCRVVVQTLQLPITTEEYRHQLENDCEYERRLSEAPLMPGVERLVRHLSNHHIPIAIASSTTRTIFDSISSKRKDFFSLFHPIILAGEEPEVKKCKPAPDTFLVCEARFQTKANPKETLVFEDSIAGVEAAVAAGMPVVMVPSKDVDITLCQKATLVLNSLQDFRPEEFGLPSL